MTPKKFKKESDRFCKGYGLPMYNEARLNALLSILYWKGFITNEDFEEEFLKEIKSYPKRDKSIVEMFDELMRKSGYKPIPMSADADIMEGRPKKQKKRN